MAHLETLNEMKEYYKENLENFLWAHPGKYILIKSGDTSFMKFKTSFYRTKWGLNRAINKYEGIYGVTFYTTKIPRFLERSKLLPEIIGGESSIKLAQCFEELGFKKS